VFREKIDYKKNNATMQETLYERLIDEMEKNGFRKVRSVIDEIYANLSEDDETISVTARDCHMITIKGIKDSTVRNGLVYRPHNISMKIYGYDGKELEPNDAIQFGITKLTYQGLPTMKPDEHTTIYYHFPYKIISIGVTFKKGIVITKDKILEIGIFRNSNRLKIAKFDLSLECDKWFKVDQKRVNKSMY
jgi:hypothetical protein